MVLADVSFINLFIPIVSFLFFLFFQIGFYRKNKSIIKSMAFGYSVGLLFYLLLYAYVKYVLRLDIIFWDILLNTFFLTILTYTYFGGIHISETSIRIKILEYIAANDGKISSAELLEKYSSDRLLKVRLERLIETGQIEKVGDNYFLLKKNILLIIKIVNFLRFLFNEKPI